MGNNILAVNHSAPISFCQRWQSTLIESSWTLDNKDLFGLSSYLDVLRWHTRRANDIYKRGCDFCLARQICERGCMAFEYTNSAGKSTLQPDSMCLVIKQMFFYLTKIRHLFFLTKAVHDRCTIVYGQDGFHLGYSSAQSNDLALPVIDKAIIVGYNFIYPQIRSLRSELLEFSPLLQGLSDILGKEQAVTIYRDGFFTSGCIFERRLANEQLDISICLDRNNYSWIFYQLKIQESPIKRNLEALEHLSSWNQIWLEYDNVDDGSNWVKKFPGVWIDFGTKVAQSFEENNVDIQKIMATFGIEDAMQNKLQEYLKEMLSCGLRIHQFGILFGRGDLPQLKVMVFLDQEKQYAIDKLMSPGQFGLFEKIKKTHNGSSFALNINVLTGDIDLEVCGTGVKDEVFIAEVVSLFPEQKVKIETYLKTCSIDKVFWAKHSHLKYVCRNGAIQDCKFYTRIDNKCLV